ncbi:MULTISPECIES: tRNA dihydrouridine synthase DusB [Methylosinus]|uniref:tRNA-dihydrouridine synthase n=1 Tax=Methylosinus trichosporium (strain ATCC 35070 / NCIMB 11131 / UNIQEM 75 / OB3b) TaxID=595536 RepID=A0A2D2CVN4_METT3|nr:MULTISPECIES: tRNA dihydrouridine synthase DusB [Methylosinus]ATQ66745.1 tRNA dihydrouridine synthase DusB [Methylosinus trichosporium OB3b]
MRIGSLHLPGRALLAPMAGVTDSAMRRIALRFGAAAAVGEMVGASALARGDLEARQRLDGAGLDAHIVQIAARDPASIAETARRAEAAGAKLIDINMGCPCKRVTGGLAGAALMRDPALAASLVRAAVGAVTVPVSVKMRLGWDDASRNAAELARLVESEGAAMVTVHGRTRAQFYEGRADWSAIAEVRRALRIPLVANGDCASPEDAAVMLERSGADAVMIGRAALGRPWLVGEVAHFLASGHRRPALSRAARLEAALEHLDGLLGLMGEAAGLRHARKHLAAYADHAPEGGERRALRQALVCTTTAEEAKRLLARLFTAEAPREAALAG